MALQAVFDTLVITGVAIVPVAMATLAWSMMQSDVFGRVVGGVALALSMAGAVGGAGAVIVGPDFAGIQVAMLSMVVFHAIVGWRMLRS